MAKKNSFKRKFNLQAHNGKITSNRVRSHKKLSCCILFSNVATLNNPN